MNLPVVLFRQCQEPKGDDPHMNIVVLDYNENFIEFLDPDLLSVTEQYEIGGIRSIDVEYYMEDMTDAKRLFCVGNKIFINGDSNLADCLYVINTEVRRDYFQENNVVFTAEDVIVELNYAPLFSQTDLTTKNGFTLSTNAGEINVTVNRNALRFWFGDYFNIGVVQDCLSTDISKISPAGTMTLMELLRYIETETCNIFMTRYEKDQQTNVIHRYLDWLNPNGNNRNWSAVFEYIPTNTTPVEPSTVTNMDDVEDEDDLVELPEFTPPVVHEPENIILSLKDRFGEVIDDYSWNAEELGLSNSYDKVDVELKFKNSVLTCTMNKKTYSGTAPTPVETNIDSSTVDVIECNAGVPSYDEDNLTTVSQDTILGNNIILPTHTRFEIYDEETDTILYSHEINPVIGDIHSDILDLGYNVENIEYEIDETDTYTSISPIISLEDSNTTNALTRDDVSTIINNWKNLRVKKGDKIPMIVQRVTSNMVPTPENMALSDVTNNYYARPLKPNDSDNKYEYLKGTAYWYAPFAKVKGKLGIETSLDTGIEYHHIQTRPDKNNPYGVMGTPKNGTINTSEENKYAIYNAVVMALKEKMQPKINIKVDVANYHDGTYNNYGLYDHVYVKIPGFETLITATVSKTTKSFHDIGENTIELDNFSIGTKVASQETFFVGDNVSLKYPKKGKLNVTLKTIDNETGLAGKLVNLTLYRYDDNGTREFRKNYTKKTNNNGLATLSINLNPGNYEIEAQFGGDIEYSPCTEIFDINISGKKTTTDKTAAKSTPKKANKKKYKTVKTYWTKCGLSPDKKQIIAISQPSGWDYQNKKDASGKKLKWQNLYKVVFENYCPYCGKHGTLRFDAGKSNKCLSHLSRGYKRGVPEGEITCTNCDCDFDSVTGVDKQPAKRWLKRLKKPVRSNKNEKAKLVKGKLQYGTKKVEVKEKKVKKVTRTHTPVGTVNKKVKEWALKKVGKKKGAAAAKQLAVAVGNIKYVGYANFVRSPATVLSKGGNCCDQTRLYLMACDAAGVSEYYTMKYVHVHNSAANKGHVFAQLINKSTGKAVYVDCTHSPWWGTYLRGWGNLPGVKTVYPRAPF